MKHFISILAILVLLSACSDGDGLSDAASAYKSGNYQTAIKILQPLADKGNALAQNNLAMMYQKGQGVKQNYALAIKYYNLAAEQGVGRAQYNLAKIYEEGLSVKQNYFLAYKYYKSASEQGNVFAQNNMALLYLRGQGVEQNYELAYMWFNLASALGYQPSVDNEALTAEELSESQIENAQKLSKQCFASSFKDCAELN